MADGKIVQCIGAVVDVEFPRNAMPKINRETLFGFTFHLPEIPEQERIAKLLLTLRSKTDELQRLQREVETELAAFVPALLAKAFRGEL